MNVEEVKKLITDKLENVEVMVETDGYQYQVTAVGDIFTDLSPVKKQQVIYGCLNDYIVDGTIHAVVIKTYTPEQWQQNNAS